jgi:hypothetical protein
LIKPKGKTLNIVFGIILPNEATIPTSTFFDFKVSLNSCSSKLSKYIISILFSLAISSTGFCFNSLSLPNSLGENVITKFGIKLFLIKSSNTNFEKLELPQKLIFIINLFRLFICFLCLFSE